MGNICRSPSAEAVFRHLVHKENLQNEIQIDSAGTHAYHVGEAPDVRSIAAGEKRGYQLSSLKARLVTIDDFEDFDYIVAMDKPNVENLLTICPERLRYKITLLLEIPENCVVKEVPDPYYGGVHGFEYVLDLIEKGTKALLTMIQKKINSLN